MALEYAARLVSLADDDASAQLERIAMVVAEWAGIQDPLSDSRRTGRRRDVVDTELLGAPADELWGWRLRLQHADDRDDAVRWAVTVTGVVEANVELSIRLDRTRIDGTVVPPRERTEPPGCVMAILESGAATFTDGGRVVDGSVWAVKPPEAEVFAEFVCSPDRRLPIFALSPRDDDVIDGGELHLHVLGIAHVALVRSEASWALDQYLPRGFNVFGGAARLWWPGIDEHASRWDHNLWKADVRADRLTREAIGRILRAGRSAAVLDGRLARLERAKRDTRTEQLRSELQRLRSQVEQQSLTASPADAEIAEAEERLVEALREDRDLALELASTEEEAARAARERALTAERDRDFWKSEALRLRASGGVAGDDPEVTLERGVLEEISAEIDRIGDVDGARKRDFALGRIFAETLVHHGDRYRGKTIRACAEVAIGAPELLRKREDHPLRVGQGGNDPTRVRASDGAEARRCAIERNTSAARRLHYWVLPDGSVEFATINVHEDMAIPE